MPLKIFDQTWQEARNPALRWTLVLAGVTWMMILVHPLFSGLAGRPLPVLLQGFLPVEAMTGAASWAWQVVMGWLVPLLVAIYAAGLGSWLVAGEEERGTLGFLLAAPVRRYRLVFEKTMVLLYALLGMIAAVWAAFVISSWMTSIPLTLASLLRGIVALMLFGLAVGGLALALGCLTGRRRLSRFITMLAVILALVAGHLPNAVPMREIHWVSPFYFYTEAIRGDTLGLVLLLVMALAAFLVAWLGFERRDIAV